MKEFSKLSQPSKIDLAYIAGFVDGEGCIGLHRNSDNSLKASITIGNAHAGALKFIQRTLGFGGLYIHVKEGNRVRQWQYQTRNMGELFKFLSLIAPYLIIKRKHAILMLRFLKSRLRRIKPGRKKTFSRKNPYNQAELKIWIQLRYLNRRGKEKTV